MKELEDDIEKTRSQIERAAQALFDTEDGGWKSFKLPQGTKSLISPLTGGGSFEVILKPPAYLLILDFRSLEGNTRETQHLILEPNQEPRILSHVGPTQFDFDTPNADRFMDKFFQKGDPAKLLHLREFKRIIDLVNNI